jgi:hypothetical protein
MESPFIDDDRIMARQKDRIKVLESKILTLESQAKNVKRSIVKKEFYVSKCVCGSEAIHVDKLAPELNVFTVHIYCLTCTRHVFGTAHKLNSWVGAYEVAFKKWNS